MSAATEALLREAEGYCNYVGHEGGQGCSEACDLVNRLAAALAEAAGREEAVCVCGHEADEHADGSGRCLWVHCRCHAFTPTHERVTFLRPVTP